MRILTATVLIFSLGACSEKEHSVVDSKQAEKVVAPASSVVPVLGTAEQTKTQAMTALEILAAFKNDIAICNSVVKLRKKDNLNDDQHHLTPEKILSEPPYVGTMEADYIRHNSKYFEIGEAYEGYPWAISQFVGQEQIFCALSRQRLEEIEALGESEEAWQIRAFFLNVELKTLEPVSELGPGGNMVGWEWWKTELVKTSHFYGTVLHPKFIEWSKNAIKQIEETRQGIQSDVDQYMVDPAENRLEVIKLNKAIDDRIKFINSLIVVKN